MNIAAIILAAGKGTRMNDDSKNKVAFSIAGVPVIRRVVENMRLGGVCRFVIVVGHNAESVREALMGVDGVEFATQSVQRGTGDAAMCGMQRLLDDGFHGKVIISMGDKIVSPSVVSRIVQLSKNSDAVWGIQPKDANPGGGHIVMRGAKAYGVVEHADAALMLLANTPHNMWREKLGKTGLNPKKIEKVLAAAEKEAPPAEKLLCGELFDAEEIFNAEYRNAALYCFELRSGYEAIKRIGTHNAQGEVYLTDALEYFASDGRAEVCLIDDPNDMLTFSTRDELRKISLGFLRKASEMLEDISSGKMDNALATIYGDDIGEERERYTDILRHFIDKYGDKKVILTRAPGRVNLMGRHIDHRGGGINVMTVNNDTVFAVSPREDDRVRISNLDGMYPDAEFCISEYMSMYNGGSWLDYLDEPAMREDLVRNSGSWANYVKSACLRFAFEFDSEDYKICGMDMMADGNIPAAAGLSSSSSIVVAVSEAIVALNSLNVTGGQLVNLCGEGEWFVGSRGGAGDHAAMKYSKRGRITHLGFAPFVLGDSAEFSSDYAIIVANSMLVAKKSEGSRDKFNSKVASYEIALMLIHKNFPEYNIPKFRDIHEGREPAEVYKILLSLPEVMSRDEAYSALLDHKEELDRLFSSHKDPGVYNVRGVALYGISECVRAKMCITALEERDYRLLGDMMRISHNGDRIRCADMSDGYLGELATNNTPLYLVAGDYGCSHERIDELCDLLDSTEGTLGSEIVGAGLGGCVIALVKSSKANSVIERIDKEYYDKYGYEHKAAVYKPSYGSAVIF